MDNSLFPAKPIPDYLLSIKYQGTSFDGVIEINALGQEILGLQTCLQRTIETLKKHKRIDFSLNDVDIYIEAFEHGSFAKKVKLAFKQGVKTVEKYPATSGIVAVVFVGMLTVYAQLKTADTKELSSTAVAELKDQVKAELVKDKAFQDGLAAVVGPIRTEQDKLIVTDPSQQEKEAVIDNEQKNKIIELAEGSSETTPDSSGYETLKGHVTRVDLDADINHIGLKINDKGALVLCTLPSNITRDQMKEFLDKWVEVEGVVTYKNGERKHVNVSYLSLTSKPIQAEIDFSAKGGE